jgi:RecB family exonuclease
VVREELGEWLSPSQVNTYLGCPARWYFHYLLGLTEPATGALALGKAFHATLATNSRRKLTSGCDLDPAEAREVFEQEFTLASEEAELREDEDAAKLEATGKALVSTYIGDAAGSIEPRAVEQTVQGQVAGVKVRGIVDHALGRNAGI